MPTKPDVHSAKIAASRTIALLPGDGIGPEVLKEAEQILEYYRAERGLPLVLWSLDLGAERYLKDKSTLPETVKQRITAECSAVLLGALGDPRIPNLDYAHEILFGLRFGFDLYANIRPVRALCDRLVPLKGKSRQDINFVVFRENTEGLYAQIGGQLRRGSPGEVAIATDINTRWGVERIVRAAFQYAQTTGKCRVHMADKSNAIRHAHELWLRVLREVNEDFPQIEGIHIYADALCLKLVQCPEHFQVIVTNNLFGDLITDLGAGLQGGLGMAASISKNLDKPSSVVLCEPVHGSAPDLVGTQRANPFAAILSVALMFGEFGWGKEQIELERAVTEALESHECTPDVGGQYTTAQAGLAVLHRLRAQGSPRSG